MHESLEDIPWGYSYKDRTIILWIEISISRSAKRYAFPSHLCRLSYKVLAEICPRFSFSFPTAEAAVEVLVPALNLST